MGSGTDVGVHSVVDAMADKIVLSAAVGFVGSGLAGVHAGGEPAA